MKPWLSKEYRILNAIYLNKCWKSGEGKMGWHLGCRMMGWGNSTFDKQQWHKLTDWSQSRRIGLHFHHWFVSSNRDWTLTARFQEVLLQQLYRYWVINSQMHVWYQGQCPLICSSPAREVKCERMCLRAKKQVSKKEGLESGIIQLPVLYSYHQISWSLQKSLLPFPKLMQLKFLKI